MMIDRLKQAFALAEQLAPEEQAALAELLLEEMDATSQWNALFADPRSERLLDQLVSEAIAEDDAGETEEIEGDSFLS
jgi:hypothetical protein